jgi:hypothetical protein
MLRELLAELGAELERQRTDHVAELKRTESMIGRERCGLTVEGRSGIPPKLKPDHRLDRHCTDVVLARCRHWEA